MEPPPGKRRRALAQLANLRCASDAAVAAIIRKVQSLENVPAQPSARAVAQALEADLLGVDTPYGPLLQNITLPMEDGSEFRWEAR